MAVVMRASVSAIPAMTWDPTSDAWFAGFADGESCLMVRTRKDGGCEPHFQLGLRADDAPILECLADAFGGRIYFRKARPEVRLPNPACVWQVWRKSDLRGIVGYFDEFPLRAKKAREYVLWRRAVHIYCRGGHRAMELPAIADALVALRAFDAPEVELAEPTHHQLHLIEGGRALGLSEAK